jgi:hypothetical protein
MAMPKACKFFIESPPLASATEGRCYVVRMPRNSLGGCLTSIGVIERLCSLSTGNTPNWPVSFEARRFIWQAAPLIRADCLLGAPYDRRAIYLNPSASNFAFPVIGINPTDLALGELDRGEVYCTGPANVMSACSTSLYSRLRFKP